MESANAKGEGANLLFGQLFLENGMKMKEIGSGRRGWHLPDQCQCITWEVLEYKSVGWICFVVSWFVIFTAHISKGMREGNVFTGVCPFIGGTPQPGMGYPLSWDGVPPPSQVRIGGGYPRMGYHPSWDGYPPRIGQHREYLLRCGRYASCIHTGGLSCSVVKTTF